MPRVEWSRHSSATGEAATRGGATSSEGSRSMPTASNSSTSAGKSTALALICSRSGSGARLTTNSPVASMLRSESLRPTEVNWTIGGSVQATVKKECGARFAMVPSAARVDTQAMGRGTTTAVRSR